MFNVHRNQMLTVDMQKFSRVITCHRPAPSFQLTMITFFWMNRFIIKSILSGCMCKYWSNKKNAAMFTISNFNIHLSTFISLYLNYQFLIWIMILVNAMLPRHNKWYDSGSWSAMIYILSILFWIKKNSNSVQFPS